MGDEKKETTKRRGRPRKPLEEAKRHPLNMRTTKQLREALERAAQESGRSLAQEVEFRIEQSFMIVPFETVLDGLLGMASKDGSAFSVAIGQILQEVQSKYGYGEVWTNLQAIDDLDKGIDALLRVVRQNIPGVDADQFVVDMKGDIEKKGAGAGAGFIVMLQQLGLHPGSDRGRDKKKPGPHVVMVGKGPEEEEGQD